MKAKSWLVTKNFADDEIPNAEEWLKKFFELSRATYVCGQLEQGLKEQRMHIQAFANFCDSKRFTTLEKLKLGCHYTVVNRDNGASDYCMKEETRLEGPWEFGVKPVRRNVKADWDEVINKAKSGRFDEIPSDILIRNYHGIQKIYKDNMVVSDSDHLRGIFISGMSGVGKSTLARGLFPGKSIYNKSHNKWWDSYKGEQVVIWDDLSPEEAKMSSTHLKLYCDRYGIMGETKGSGVPLVYEYFIITSQYSFEECFPDTETRQAMERRCFIYEMMSGSFYKFVMDDMIAKLYDTSKKIDVEDYIVR